MAIIQHDPLAFVFQLTSQTRKVVDECLETSSTFAEALGNIPLPLRQSVLDELSLYVDIRNDRDGQPELYFKKEQ